MTTRTHWFQAPGTVLAKLIRAQLSNDTVVLSAPTSPRKFLLRCRLTALILLVGIVRLVAFGSGSELGILALLLFCGGLEYLGGAAVVGWSFLGSLAVASAIQTWALHCPTGLDLLLGALGCAGGLVWFLKRRSFLIGFVVTYSLVARFALKDPRANGFLMAFLVGLVLTKAFLEIRDRRLIN